MSRVAIIVCAWNHLATTTRPCLDSIRRFSDRDYRVIVIDNASVDGTAEYLARLTARDDRIECIRSVTNVGWADGTIAGLRALRDGDTHVCLLNSDTLVMPGWLSRLMTRLEPARPDVTGVMPNEFPHAKRTPRANAGAIVPGSGAATPAPPLDRILEFAGEVAQRFADRTLSAAPSGFCYLTARANVPLLVDYLTDFDRYRSGELDWQQFWRERAKQSLVAQDVFVFHARGGSGGYYAYDGERAL